MNRLRRWAMTLLLVAGGARVVAGLAASEPARPCLAHGDEAVINAALAGPGARVLLCPRAVIEISHPIVMSAADQELATAGAPPGDARAIVRVVGERQATAIESRASGIHLHHLIVDGGRPARGRLEQGGALIELGGDVRGIRVDHVHSFDPRGWSALHVFEGSGQCTDASITDNVLGPAGTPDGAWADGLSFACRHGLVADNLILDASDGGIVIFGAPGTLVRDNVVRTTSNTLLGGINLVDFKPFHGDYTGVVVRGNRIEAQGGFIKIAIAAGPAAWGMGSEINHGATVVDNRIVGRAFGYGIVADGVADFMFTGNRVLSTLTGGRDTRCDARHVPSGVPFVRDAGDVTSRYQAGFTAGPARWSICVEPR